MSGHEELVGRWEEARATFGILRRMADAVVRRLHAAAWTRTRKEEERGPLSLKRLVVLSTSHAVYHANQIKQMRETLAPAV